MASSDILSQTLSTITAIKLEELGLQRSSYEAGKAELLNDIATLSQRQKVDTLLTRIDDLASMGKLDLLSVKNVRKFLEQSRHDPSVSDALLKDWQGKIESQLDIHSVKYQYASLYGELVNEWLSASAEASSYEQVGRKEMHEQRTIWEEYVFKAKHTDPNAIGLYLTRLFGSTKDIKAAYSALRRATELFEHTMAKTEHFDEDSLTWVIKGLLRSDLVTDDKRQILKDFLNNKVVLAEIADVLNMRMASLDKWKWAPEGTPVEQRRHLNGRYRFYHDEDLLQAILLRYIGVKWSVFFKEALTEFQSAPDVWKPSSTPVPGPEKTRRDYFLGIRPPGFSAPSTVEAERETHYKENIFLDHLQETIGEQRGGYAEDDLDEADTRKSSQEITQGLLHVLATEIIMKTRLGEEVCVVRSDFKWFGPSLPHSTMFAILEFFNVSERWISFFRRALEAPMFFINDGDNAPVQIRKRGTPISGPLSDMLAETVLFVLDFAMNQLTDGARLYRLHDDIWFWGQQSTCIKGWAVMTEFAALMGLEFAPEKTGSVRITRRPNDKTPPISPKLPKGSVHWGLLQLDAATGRFLIDQDAVDTHIEELSRQLASCKSVFDWIQAWNIYGARFFSTNFGRPANCYGRAHVDMILETFERIQSKLFASTGGSVTSTLKNMLTERFGVTDIPEGYLYFPISMGGLDLKSPFVNLYLIRNRITASPDLYMTNFFNREEAEYRSAKKRYADGSVVRKTDDMPWEVRTKFGEEGFMSFEEFTRYREQTSELLAGAYKMLVAEPEEEEVECTSDVAAILGPASFLRGGLPGRGRGGVRGRGGRGSHGRSMPGMADTWSNLSPYHRWIIQLYAPDMIARFGGLNVVEKGLLPTGMVNMFRETRFKWQG